MIPRDSENACAGPLLESMRCAGFNGLLVLESLATAYIEYSLLWTLRPQNDNRIEGLYFNGGVIGPDDPGSNTTRYRPFTD